MSDKIANLIGQILEEVDSGAMVTGYVFMIEGIDTDGERAIYFDTNDQAKRWETMGRLSYGIELERSHIYKDE